jgi:3'(2'), 5'-bisphosphate nucleotidase
MHKYLADLKTLVRDAGHKLLRYCQTQGVESRQELLLGHKADFTPVSGADLYANELLLTGLRALAPELPIISEESPIPDWSLRQEWRRFWLLDPLDGTRGFLAGSNEFTFNIALIEDNQPILAVIYAPSQQICYYAARAQGAYRELAGAAPARLSAQAFDPAHCRLWLGRAQELNPRVTAWVNHQAVRVQRSHSAIKFCYLAEGLGDIYPRFGPTGEWDTAAGQCMLEAVGGAVVDLQGQPLSYNQKASLINPAFVALADASAVDRVLDWMQQRRLN